MKFILIAAIVVMGAGCAAPAYQSNIDVAMRRYCNGRGYMVTNSGNNVFIPDPHGDSVVYTETATLICR